MNDRHSIVTNNIFILKINSVENASAVNIGENYLYDWNNSAKYTQGFGSNYGDACDFLGLKSAIDDRDLIDSPSTYRKSYESIPREGLNELHADVY
ncbi:MULTISPECIES: hypothetical protein [unclassified Virgibacillus]|uniref:hypothetical protein n=1 Tax=unclassified Virgibacillus TaxID=2620237 RepID=UPI0024DE78BE|nr:hypothetical protein [Virgibacillus sp. LDC-1]